MIPSLSNPISAFSPALFAFCNRSASTSGQRPLESQLQVRNLASLDANFWWGGVTSLSVVQNLATKQTGSRIGATAAWRFSKHQSLKISYSDGTYIRFGGSYHVVQAAWQYSWLGWPKIR
jgi:hypothetical protein